jgi:hypothetical protein
MLIKELWCAVDMIVRTSIRSSHDHHCQTRGAGRRWMIDTIIVDWGLQQMGIFLKPGCWSAQNVEDYSSFRCTRTIWADSMGEPC